MIPLNLTIEGLYSYRTRQSIDFTNLTQAGLFGIFGGVGSGKSSILEAISFALYNESERLNSRDNRNYNMMNLKSDKLFIDFEFRSGTGDRYRFVVHGKRNKKVFDNVKAFERTAYQLKKNKWEPISPDNTEIITGLNYQNFHRTIIIPQGKFQEFLQLKTKDRTNMLKELFNLSKYELFDKVARLESRNNATKQNLSGRMQEIGETDPEKIKDLEESQACLQKEIQEAKTCLEGKEKSEQESENLRKLSAEVAEKKQQQTDLLQSEKKIKKRKQKVKEFELFTRIFKADTVRLEEAETSSKRKSEELTAANEQLTTLKQDLAEVQDVYKKIKNEYDNRDKMLKESEELGKLAKIKKLGQEKSILIREAEVIKKEVKEITRLLSNGKRKQKELTTKLGTFRKELPDLRMLSEIKAWFTEKDRLAQNIDDKKGKIDKNDESLKALNIQVHEKLVLSGVFASIPKRIDLDHFLKRIDGRIFEIEEALKAATAEIVHLEITHQLESYASELKEDKPCPLCGSESHPNILKSSNIIENLKKAKVNKKTLDAQLKECHKLKNDLTVLKSRNESIQKDGLDLNKELKKLQTLVKEHVNKFVWKGFGNEDDSSLKVQETRYQSMDESIKILEQDITTINEEVDKNELFVETKKADSDQVNQQLVTITSQIELLRSQIGLVDVHKYNSFTIEQLIQKTKELDRDYNNLVQRFTETEKKHNILSSSVDSQRGKIGAMEKANQELLDHVDKLHKKIKSKLKENGGLKLSNVLEVLAQELDMEAEEKAIQEFYQNLEVCRTRLKELTKQLAGRTYDEDIHLLLKEEILSLKQAIDKKNQELGKLGKEIKTMKSNVKKYIELQTKLTDILLRGDDITELKNLFRGSGFVNYISTVYLQNLCKAANERFYKLTRQSLGLELAEDNSFLVRDYMNEGRLRSVKTLSGGQTFQASLSLALSLADGIQKLSGSTENFFFLDEGFGTLDKETLGVAFDTLKALRKENRIVGVISHVDEMQDEIETYLKVTNDEEHGSVVTASWES